MRWEIKQHKILFYFICMLKIYYDCAHMNMNHETKFEFKIEN
jgi:hypothetical protein